MNLNSSQNRSDCESALTPGRFADASPISVHLPRTSAAAAVCQGGNTASQSVLHRSAKAIIGGITLNSQSISQFGYGFGGSMRFVYTLSSLKDDGIVNTSSAQIVGDFASEYSRMPARTAASYSVLRHVRHAKLALARPYLAAFRLARALRSMSRSAERTEIWIT